jgi:hypothetical protein
MPFEDAVLDAVRRYASVFLRLALGATFLTAVGDRFRLWGPAGAANRRVGGLPALHRVHRSTEPLGAGAYSTGAGLGSHRC